MKLICNPDREESAGKPTNIESKLPNGKNMNRLDIICMAREAGFADGVVDIVGFEGFANFAALVAAHEREECAKFCDEQYVFYGFDHVFAAGIRARGKK
jgi:hypothetical protein